MPENRGPDRVVRMTPDDAFAVLEAAVEIAMEAPRERLSREDKMRMSMALDLTLDFAKMGVQVVRGMENAKKGKPQTAAPAKAEGEVVLKGNGETPPSDIHEKLTQAAKAAETTE